MPTPSPPLSLLFLLLLIIPTLSASSSILRKHSSLNLHDTLTSPSSTFTLAFHTTGLNAYYLSIYHIHSIPPISIWIANRNSPLNSKSPKLTLRADGTLALTDVDQSIIWTSNTNTTTSADVDYAELLESGNLVLKNPRGSILWESFDFPTNTLLPGQRLTKSSKLVSDIGIGDFGVGYFSLMYGNDNVLRLIYDGPEVSSLYWPDPDGNLYAIGRTNYNSTRVAKLDVLGGFKSSDRLEFNASDYGKSVMRRLTLDYDGNLRLYSLDMVTGLWNISWIALGDQCKIHGVCGRYGVCSYEPAPKCSCPPGYEVSNPSNWNEGCRPMFNRTCSGKSGFQQEKVKYLKLLNTDYYGFDLNFTQYISLEECKRICDDDCSCEGFSYRLTGQALCFAKSALFNGFSSPDFSGTIYLKVPLSVGDELEYNNDHNGADAVCNSSLSTVHIGSLTMYDLSNRVLRWSYLYGFAGIIGGTEILLAIIAWWFLFRKHGVSASLEDGYRAITSQFKVFSYAELKTATNNFKEKIGQGGSGAVFKGTLDDERVIAVKRLGDIVQGDEVFKSELSTIGKINHMNLVRMWGYCSEKRHKLIVYEHIKNRSLDKHLFYSSPTSLTWNQRFRVALGTAKALAYLHHECLEWVIHCDVKPENILLDNDFEPKIADFGLAKLSQRDKPSSQFSHIRGTKGYMAPEWTSNLPITAKVDVYSYGVVILELVRGVRFSKRVLVADGAVEEDEMVRFVREAKVRIKGEEEEKYSWVEEIMDGEFDSKQAVCMLEIGISCVEEDCSKRPTMDNVVSLLLKCEDL